MATWYQKNKDKKFAVLGLGLSGLACLRFLSSKAFDVVVFDTRNTPPDIEQAQAFIDADNIYLGEFDHQTEKKLSQLDYIVISPGLDPRLPIYQRLRALGVVFINEIELFALATQKPVIAITGSNGKSTVTSLLGHVLNQAGMKAAIGGNIGIPALSLLLDCTDADIYVLELSSFQLEYCPHFKAEVSLVLNVCDDHLDRYDDLVEYAMVKRRIFNATTLAIFNAEDDFTHPVNSELSIAPKAQVGFYTDNITNPVTGWSVINGHACLNSVSQYSLIDAALVGKHNQANLLAVSAVADFYQLDRLTVELAFASYQSLNHRCQLVSRKAGINWIDDSKATNVGATVAAIKGLAQVDKKLILIAGGVGKGADFSPLKSVMAKQVTTLITLGRDGDKIAELFSNTIRVEEMVQAVNEAYHLAQADDVVLLSPACASLDMFNNFEHRGQVFQQCVEALDDRA